MGRTRYRPTRPPRPFLRRLAGLAVALILALLAAGVTLDHLERLRFFGGPLLNMLRPPGTARAPRDGLGVIVLSGDMGFRVGLSPAVARRMAEAGYPVIGVNSLSFAANGRSPAEIRALVMGCMRRLLAMPGVHRIVLIGHSFGADLLHVGLADLPAAYKARVALVILEVPTDSIYLTAGFREYFEIGTPDVPAFVSAVRLNWVPVTCIRGATETTSLCPMLGKLDLPNVRQVVLPGGHKLNRDDAALFAASFDAIQHHRR